MVRQLILIILSFGLCTVIGASAASAGDVRCLWRSLSTATQEDLVRRKSENPTAPIPPLQRPEVISMVQGCLLTKETIKPAGVALIAYANELAEQHKADRYIYRGGPVEVTWKELPSNERADFRTWVSTLGGRTVSNQELAQHFAPLFQALGVSPPSGGNITSNPQYNVLALYFECRAIRELQEAKF